MGDASTCETCGRTPGLGNPRAVACFEHDAGCRCAECVRWCWASEAYETSCDGTDEAPVDWRARALRAEAERDALRAELATARELVAVLEERIDTAEATANDFFERAKALDGRHREGRALLHRLARFALAPHGGIRVVKVAQEVIDYLNRTHDPADILRDGKAGGA